MSDQARYAGALTLPRSGWRRRLEVFSPKIGRRLSLGSYDAWRTWLMIEANPQALGFCERPARVDGPRSPMIDFWVQLRERRMGEFWLLADPEGPDKAGASEPPALPAPLHGLPVRVVRKSDLATWSLPIANWSRIVPYLVAHRRFPDPLLEQSIVVALARFASLDAVLRRFSDRDSTQVQTALFALVASGRLVSPDLAAAPLSGATRFRRL